MPEKAKVETGAAEMLRGEDIICFSWLVWDSIPLVMHQMMRRLSKANRVLFVDPPVAYSNLLIKPSLFKGHMKKTGLWLGGVRKETENLYICYPPPLILQYGHIPLADRVSQALIAKAVRRAAAKLGFSSPILWISHPYAVMPAGQFNEKAVCYDCNDDVGFFFCQNFNKRTKLGRIEDELTRRAGVVFVTSKYLFDSKKALNPNIHYLPSGVDLDEYRRALSPSYKVAPELDKIPRPVVGFVGGMSNSKMNWEWIRHAAGSRTGWSFVFVGPSSEPPPPFIGALKNVIFTGPRPPETMPSYIKGFDVCIIPYQGDEFLKSCSPTKAFEYLAMGKPVVSSRIPDIEDLGGLVWLSGDCGEFARHLDEAVEEGRNGKRAGEYMRAAEGRTWDGRLEKASSLIEAIL